MSDPVTMIRQTMESDLRALGLVAQNVANAETVGYQRGIATATGSFIDVAGEVAADAAAPTPTVTIDRTPGALKASAEPTHVALAGPGYFVVSEDGRDMLTRRGDFRIDRDGNLSNVSGALVQGTQGPIQVGAGTLAIDAEGHVKVDGRDVDRLLVVEPWTDGAAPAPGEGPPMSDGAGPLREVDHPQVRQGFLEQSNVSAVNEMINLMQVLRHFEMAQRYARGADDMLGTAIGTLGKL